MRNRVPSAYFFKVMFLPRANDSFFRRATPVNFRFFRRQFLFTRNTRYFRFVRARVEDNSFRCAIVLRCNIFSNLLFVNVRVVRRSERRVNMTNGKLALLTLGTIICRHLFLLVPRDKFRLKAWDKDRFLVLNFIYHVTNRANAGHRNFRALTRRSLLGK